MDEGKGAEHVSFIVRVVRDELGNVSGVVERVRSGRRARFQGVAAIGLLIGRMLEDERGPRTEESER